MDPVSVPKKVNNEVSCDGICKFEIGTIKNHYKDIDNDILDKRQKKPPKRGIFSPKSPRGTQTRVFSGVSSNSFMFITIVFTFLQNFIKI